MCRGLCVSEKAGMFPKQIQHGRRTYTTINSEHTTYVLYLIQHKIETVILKILLLCFTEFSYILYKNCCKTVILSYSTGGKMTILPFQWFLSFYSVPM